MAINKDTQVNASVVLNKNIYQELKSIAKINKRSTSSQIAYIIENFLKESNSNKGD